MSDFDLDAVKAIIINGLDSGADDDMIRMEMFKASVPFNKINALFKETAIEGGFRADPKIVREAIQEALVDVELESLATWDDVTSAASTIHGNIDGATEGQVISALKKAAEEAELEFPKKPKSAPRSRGASKIKSLIVDMYNADPETSTTDAMTAIVAECGGTYRVRNALEYFNMYVPVILAAKNSCSLSEVKVEAPNKDALIAEYGGTASYTAGADADSTDVDAEDDDDEMMVA